MTKYKFFREVGGQFLKVIDEFQKENEIIEVFSYPNPGSSYAAMAVKYQPREAVKDDYCIARDKDCSVSCGNSNPNYGVPCTEDCSNPRVGSEFSGGIVLEICAKVKMKNKDGTLGKNVRYFTLGE